jgi:hypothetical protein
LRSCGIGLALLLLALGGYWPFLPNLITDWSNFAYFAVCFAIGAVIAIWPGLETRLAGEATRLLVLMLVAFAGLVVCGESSAGRLFVGLTAWGAIGAGFGYAARIQWLGMSPLPPGAQAQPARLRPRQSE